MDALINEIRKSLHQLGKIRGGMAKFCKATGIPHHILTKFKKGTTKQPRLKYFFPIFFGITVRANKLREEGVPIDLEQIEKLIYESLGISMDEAAYLIKFIQIFKNKSKIREEFIEMALRSIDLAYSDLPQEETIPFSKK